MVLYDTKQLSLETRIILEDELNSTGNFSILLEDGNQLITEDFFSCFW